MFSIVILTLNSRYFIEKCLDSIYNQHYSDLEVIVVDNGSRDDTVEFISIRYPDVVLIKNRINLGSASARNQGIEAAKREWILSLDCDIILGRGFFVASSEIIKNISVKTGMLQAKILYADKGTVFSAGIRHAPLMRFYDIGNGQPPGFWLNRSTDVFGVCSAASFYKREMLDEIKDANGYFDERFFFLFEDVDLAWRAREKGWGAQYQPGMECFHHGNSSLTSKRLRQYYCWRNRRFILNKHKIGMFEKLFTLFCYDFPRLIWLIIVNPHVRKKMNINFFSGRRKNTSL